MPTVLASPCSPLGGEAAAAGVKVGDEIVEVNGHNCKAMQLPELMQLKSLLQHVATTRVKEGECLLLPLLYSCCCYCCCCCCYY